jgi:hypothetical protein
LANDTPLGTPMARCDVLKLLNMTNQFWSAEQRLARWVIYPVLAAPIVATLLRDLGVGAAAPWIIYASVAVPMIAILSHLN